MTGRRGVEYVLRRVGVLAMKRYTVFLWAAALLIPPSASAGTITTQPAPVLGDAGLIALGVGLLGAGVAFLRR